MDNTHETHRKAWIKSGDFIHRMVEVVFLSMSVSTHMEHATAEPLNRKTPNIILIVADDLGWNDVSFHGSSQIPTPHIDRLAREGVILNNYYVAPICTPSRSCLMTGKYPIHLGTQHNVINAVEPWGLGLNETILPQYLKKAGYRTEMIGKWHLGFFSEKYLPMNRGFDGHFGYYLGHSDYFDHTGQESDDWGLDLRDGPALITNLTGKYSTDLFTKRAERIILRHSKTQPLFLYLAHQAVHSANEYDPLQTTTRYYNRFTHIHHTSRRLFAGMVAGLDESVGRIYHALKQQNMTKNTLIIFTTDNGGAAAGFDYNYASNYPLRGVKDTLWEGGVRGAAFIWSHMLAKKSRVSNQLMHISDWLPTLLSATGNSKKAPSPANLDGIDMWQALSTGSPSPRTEILLNIDHARDLYALRLGDYKITLGTTYNTSWDGWYPPEGQNVSYSPKPARVSCAPPPGPQNATKCLPLTNRPCLFNIAKDPCEYDNLADKQPDILEKLLNRLKIHNATVVTPRNQPGDPAAKPIRHGYIWQPWIKLP